MRPVAKVLLFVAAGLAMCACARSGDEAENSGAKDVEMPGALDIVGAAIEGQWHRRAARDMRDEDLLAELIALAEDPELAGTAADDAAISETEARLGLDLPADLEAVLRAPGAIGALEWHEVDAIERADALGDELGQLLRVEGDDWRTRELLVEDLDGGSAEFPAGDLAGYLVLGRSVLGDVLLYDASPQPKHACCRLIETPVIRNDTPTAYASLHDWLATEWAMERAID